MCQTALWEKDTDSDVLLAALELSAKTWKVALGARGRTSQVTVAAGDLPALWEAFTKTKRRFGLDPAAAVLTCYEAGRDGFWIHRELEKAGVRNLVVDAASIEVDRRQRRAKTDRLDAGRLLAQLQRWYGGERKALRTVRVPSVAAEDARRSHRELGRLRKERTGHSNRLRSLLVLHGIRLSVGVSFPQEVEKLGEVLPAHLRAEMLREYERWQLVSQQIRALESEQHREVRQPSAERHIHVIRQLSALRAVGEGSARVFACELFGWRDFDNPRQVGAVVGLTGTPYASGTLNHEQGISKAGNRRVRAVLIEIAWCWLRYQPESKLTKWFHTRFTGSARLRRIGIVALARRLIIDLWRYVRDGVVPEGAQFKPRLAA